MSEQTCDSNGNGGTPLPSSDVLGTVEQRFFPLTLDGCPPGLFIFNDSIGFKTEYSDQNGPEAYCVESGEYFWGGTRGDKEARRKLIVVPIIIKVPNDQELSHGDKNCS